MTFTRRTFMETTCALSAGLVFGSVAHREFPAVSYSRRQEAR